MSGMRVRRFLGLDGIGDMLWATTYVAIGWLAGEPFFRLVAIVMHYAGSAASFFVGALALYLSWKMLQRLRFRSQLRVARLSAGELKRRIDQGDEMVLVDLRHRREVEESGNTLPGALQISPEELYLRHEEITRGRDVVLFCS
jgi:hypothetical protein